MPECSQALEGSAALGDGGNPVLSLLRGSICPLGGFFIGVQSCLLGEPCLCRTVCLHSSWSLPCISEAESLGDGTYAHPATPRPHLQAPGSCLCPSGHPLQGWGSAARSLHKHTRCNIEIFPHSLVKSHGFKTQGPSSAAMVPPPGPFPVLLKILKRPTSLNTSQCGPATLTGVIGPLLAQGLVHIVECIPHH